MLSLKTFNTIIFDCDGVILDSNHIKTRAFYEVALEYGLENSKRLVSYHKQNGGISRYKKFEYFFKNILGQENADKEVAYAISRYGNLVRKLLFDCSVTEGLAEFLELLPAQIKRFVVTGGNEEEVKDVLSTKKLGSYFDEIWGSPRTKEEIIQNAISQGLILKPALYIGDSIYDYECSVMFDMQFMFLTKYSEVEDWEFYFDNKPVYIYENLFTVTKDIFQ